MVDEQVTTIDISSEHALGRPSYCKSLDVTLVPGTSTSLAPAHKLFVVPTDGANKEVPIPAAATCTAVVEPGLVVLGCGSSHALLDLNADKYPIKKFKWHIDVVTDLAVVDGNQIVSGSADGQIYLCDLTNVALNQYPTPVISHNVGPHNIVSVAPHPTEKHLISWTTEQGHLQLFDTRESPRVVASVLVLPGRTVSSHQLYRNDAIIGFKHGLVQVLDLRTMSPFKSYKDDVFSTVNNLDVCDDSWCAFFGSGLRAVPLVPFLRTPEVPTLAAIDAFAPSEIPWAGLCIAPATMIAATNNGFLKKIDLEKLQQQQTAAPSSAAA